MEVDEILKKAKDAVENADIPDNLQSKAFEKAVELYSGKFTSAGNNKGHSQDSIDSNLESDDSVLGKISQKTNIESSRLSEIYLFEDENLKIVTTTGLLESSNAGATKQIALLTAGGRQLGGIEDWTSTEEIRNMCDYFGKYDAANFAKTVSGMDSVFSQTGKGRNRAFKLKRPGQEKFKKLILELLGED